MMKDEGAEALTYGEAQGYRALRELVCHKYDLFERLEVTPENIIVSNGSGHALSLAFSAFVDVGDVILTEAPTFSGTLHTIRRHGPEILDVPVDGDGIVTERGARAPGGSCGSDGQALQADLHHRQLPEPRRPDADAGAPRGAGRARARVRHVDPRGRRLRRAPLRGRADAVALRARPERPRDPRGHAVEDPRRGRPARLALRAGGDDPRPSRASSSAAASTRSCRAWRPTTCATHGGARRACSSTSTGPSATRCCAGSGGARRHRRRDQQARGRLLHLDQAADRRPIRSASARSRPREARVQYTPGPASSRTAAARSSSGSPTATSRPSAATRARAASRRRSWRRVADSGDGRLGGYFCLRAA